MKVTLKITNDGIYIEKEFSDRDAIAKTIALMFEAAKILEQKSSFMHDDFPEQKPERYTTKCIFDEYAGGCFIEYHELVAKGKIT